MSITKQQILEADNKELPDLIGQVLNPDAYEWDKNGISHKIPLNWDNAMKYSELSIKEYGLIYFLEVLHTMGLRHIFDIAVLTKEQRLKASAICKINKA